MYAIIRCKFKIFDKSTLILLGSFVSIILSIVISCIFNIFLICSKVSSASMEPTIKIGDHIIGYKLDSNNKELNRGDIIIFHHPDNYNLLYIKRIIGLPDEILTIEKGNIYIDGRLLIEDYISETMVIEDKKIFHVPKYSYFVMGDNRNFSDDSRYWDNSYVLSDYIIAKVNLRVFPTIKVLK